MQRKRDLKRVNTFDEGLKYLSNIETLGFTGVSFVNVTFDDDKINTICELLRQSTCIIEGLEFFNHNSVTEQHVFLISEALRDNNSLLNLSFGRNQLPDVALNCIINVLKEKNTSLVNFSLIFFYGLSQEIKTDMEFLLQRNSLLTPGLRWTKSAWKLANKRKDFAKLTLACFEINNITIETHGRELINLFTKQKENERNLNCLTMKEIFLKKENTYAIYDFVKLAVLLKTLGVLTEKDAHRDKVSLFHLLLVHQGSHVMNETEMEEGFLLLCEHFSPLEQSQIGSAQFYKFTGLQAILKALRTTNFSPFLGAKLVTFIVEDENINCPIKNPGMEKLFEEIFIALLNCKYKSKKILKVNQTARNEAALLRAVKMLLKLGLPIIELEYIHNALVNGLTTNYRSPDNVAEIILALHEKDIRLSVLGAKDDLFTAFLDCDLRGAAFYNSIRCFYKSGYTLSLVNEDNRSVLDYVLYGPPSAAFSQFGNIKTKKKRFRKMLQVHGQFKSLRRNREILNLAAGSGRQSNASMLSENPTINTLFSGKQKRVSMRCENFLEYREVLERDLNVRAYNPMNFQEDVVRLEVDDNSKFDSLEYVRMLEFFLSEGLVDNLNLVVNKKTNVLEVLLSRCQHTEENLFEAFKALFDCGFDVQKVKEFDNPRIEIGRYLLGQLLSSKGFTALVMSSLLQWLVEQNIDFDGLTLEGISVCEHLLKSRSLDKKKVLKILDILLSTKYFSLLVKSQDNGSFLDWVCKRSSATNMITARAPLDIVEILDFARRKRPEEVDVNMLLVDGASLFEVLVKSFSKMMPNRTQTEENTHQSLTTLFEIGFSIDTKNVQNEDCFAILLNNTENDRLPLKFATRIFELLVKVKGEDFANTQDEAFCTAFWEALVQKVNISTKNIIQRLIDVSFSFPESTSCIESLLIGNADKCSMMDFVGILQLLQEQGIDLKSKQPEIFEKLFLFQARTTELDFISALNYCCGENSQLKLDVDTVDKRGRVFRQHLENNDSEVIRNWAKQQKAYDTRYRKDEGAPVHKSATCEVVFAVDVYSQKKVALKIMNNKQNFDAERFIREELEKSDQKIFEKFILQILAHKSLSDQEHYLVMARADRSLFDVINTERFTGRDIGKIVTIAKQAAFALRFMSRAGYVHGDFKPRNFMRTNFEHRVWKMIDLDCSLKIGDNRGTKCSTGYCPPEMAKSLFLPHSQNIKAATSYDVWTFGVVLFELLTGTPLFLRDQTDDKLFTLETKVKLMNWVSLGSNYEKKYILPHAGTSKLVALRKFCAYDLLQQCLVTNTENRISIDDVVVHPFLTSDDKNFKKKAKRLAKKLTQRATNRYTIGLSLSEIPQLELALEHHLFLSYVQKEGSEIVRTVYYGLSHLGADSWLDMRAKRITEEGMLKGVLTSRSFLMVLTKNSFFRPFCVKELLWAIHHCKSIIFVYESDERFHSFSIRDFFLTWQGSIQAEQNYQTLVDDFGDLDGFGLNGKLDMKSANESDNPVEFILKEYFTDYLRKNLKEQTLIPYRRREYENKAMMAEILRRAGYVTLNELESTEEEVYEVFDNFRLVILEPELPTNQEFCEDVIGTIKERFSMPEECLIRVKPVKGRSYSVELKKLVEQAEAEEVVIFGVVALMAPGFFKYHKVSLNTLFDSSKRNSDNFLMLKRAIVGIQSEWFNQPQNILAEETNSVSKEIRDMFLLHCEIMVFRPLEPRPYENIAMRGEICTRIRECYDRVSAKVAKQDVSRREKSDSKSFRSNRTSMNSVWVTEPEVS